jgi:hypothetical protein
MTNPLFQHLAGHYTLNPAPKTIIVDPCNGARAARRSVGFSPLAIAPSKRPARSGSARARNRCLRQRRHYHYCFHHFMSQRLFELTAAPCERGSVSTFLIRQVGVLASRC